MSGALSSVTWTLDLETRSFTFKNLFNASTKPLTKPETSKIIVVPLFRVQVSEYYCKVVHDFGRIEPGRHATSTWPRKPT